VKSMNDTPNAIKWTKRRKSACKRDAKGRFQEWIGGRSKREMKTPKNNYHGTAVHVGKEFAAQHGRPARVGDMVRTKTSDGTYHASSYWYVKTPKGWRNTGYREKPSPSVTTQMKARARGGRK
jgi:hypothetical protein